MSEAPSVHVDSSHLCCAFWLSRDEMRCKGTGIIKIMEPVGSSPAGAGKEMPFPPLLCGFLSLFSSLPVRQMECRQ